MVQLAAFLDRVGAAFGSHNGPQLAQLMSLTKGIEQVELASLSSGNIAQICQSKLGRLDQYAEVITGMLQARKCIDVQAYQDAYTAQIGSVMYVPWV